MDAPRGGGEIVVRLIRPSGWQWHGASCAARGTGAPEPHWPLRVEEGWKVEPAALQRLDPSMDLSTSHRLPYLSPQAMRHGQTSSGYLLTRAGERDGNVPGVLPYPSNHPHLRDGVVLPKTPQAKASPGRPRGGSRDGLGPDIPYNQTILEQQIIFVHLKVCHTPPSPTVV